MDKEELVKKAQSHLQVLCSEIGERRVGSKSNRESTYYVENKLKEFGWYTEKTPLSVIDWHTEGAVLTCHNQHFEVFSSQYSLGCSVSGELIAINTIEQLEKTNILGKIVLLYGAIASEQIAPKNFPFWNPEGHQHLVSELENGKPQALICATERNSELAGGLYPFPLFEDGDFNIPSVYMKDTEGEKLLPYAGQNVTLVSSATRIHETAYNIVARNEECTDKKRIVISAHIDTKIGTTGAIDNGTGVTTLLLLAEMLQKQTFHYPIELVFFNGEDYYSAPGQVKYIEQNTGRFDNILLDINIDGAGYLKGPSCFSPLELSDEMMDILHEVLWDNPKLVEGLPWYQGDHSVFIQQGCPAIAVSSQWLIENMESQEITHTPKDNLNIVDYERLAECAIGISEIIQKLKP